MFKFRDLQEGECRTAYGYVVSMTDGHTRTGKPKLTLTLTDGTEDVAFSNFNDKVENLRIRGITEGSVVEAQIEKNNGYYNYRTVFLNTDPSVVPEMFKHMAPIDIDHGFEEILATVRKSREEAENPKGYADVAEYLLTKFAASFKRSSAAKSNHHNYIGGLVHHTLTMIRVAVKMCEIYTDLDKELLIAGTALHDIGKIEELDTDDMGSASYTPRGLLEGHLWIGSKVIDQAWRRLGKKNSDHLHMLTHMVISHHGKQEWGAIRPPAFKEAYMLHYIDMIDAHMKELETAYEKMEPGTTSDSKPFWAEGYIYKPIE